MHARVLSVICVLLATATVVQSRRWYATEVSCWITQKKVPATWEDARQRCERNGRRLDDMPMAVFDAIQQLDLEQGDCLSMDRHGIRSVSCWDHLPYICYSNETMKCGSALATTHAPPTTTSTPPPTSTIPPALTMTQAPPTTTSAPPPTSTIPPGYTYYAATHSWYRVHEERTVSWDEATATCVAEGAHLLVLDDVEEARVVTDLAFAGSFMPKWVGLRDLKPRGVSDWRSINGDSVGDIFNVWATTRSGEFTPACAALARLGHLDDFNCATDKLPFICEKNI